MVYKLRVTAAVELHVNATYYTRYPAMKSVYEKSQSVMDRKLFSSWLFVIIMSRTSLRVNLLSIVTATGYESTTTSVVSEHSIIYWLWVRIPLLSLFSSNIGKSTRIKTCLIFIHNSFITYFITDFKVLHEKISESAYFSNLSK